MDIDPKFRARALRKLLKTIDLICDVQNLGYSSDFTADLLKRLQALHNSISKRKARTPR